MLFVVKYICEVIYLIEITARKLRGLIENDNISADKLQELVVKSLERAGKKAATAESCTGGLISKRITDVCGAAEVFECGVCSYSNRIKNKILGVKQDTLDTVGAVSEETAKQMSNGVMKLAGADFGVSVTGIAGPTGGTKEKPVGLVYISVCDKTETLVIKALFGDAENPERNVIRGLSSDAALYFLYKRILELCF